MIKLQIIALFLSMLMTLQMLPIAQIGQMLSTNQWTEELPHNALDNGSKAEGNLNSNFFPPEMNYNLAMNAERKALAYLHSSDQIPTNHSTDIVTPPPDTCA
ncbi:MAG: hypothetical protein WKI04_09840 [Ferruginibacter sp.]